MKNFQKKISTIVSTRDGLELCNAIKYLVKNEDKLEAEERETFMDVLMEYAFHGIIDFHRSHALSTAEDIMQEGDRRYAVQLCSLLRCGMQNVEYWAVSGYGKSMGKESYQELVSFLTESGHSLDSRAHAVKVISLISRQTFDAGKQGDPGYWKESDIDTARILAWQAQGYPDGNGYEEPKCHSSLQEPATEMEMRMSKLEEKLSIKRLKRQDPANPSNWLALGDSGSLPVIRDFIANAVLPEDYWLFLERYSPIRCDFYIRKFGEVHISGAKDLVEYQQGYALSGEERLEGWPEFYLVFADSNADPFCFDMTQQDSPVYFASHGMGSWEFDVCYKSFMAFLKAVSV